MHFSILKPTFQRGEGHWVFNCLIKKEIIEMFPLEIKGEIGKRKSQADSSLVNQPFHKRMHGKGYIRRI